MDSRPHSTVIGGSVGLLQALGRPWWKAPALGAFVVCFLALRAANLTALPIFVDEGIHLQWAFRMRETGRLLGITDGGRYFPIALYALVAAPASDPLWAARMCSGLFGLVAALGLIELGRLLYTRAAGFVAAILCLVVPFCLFHERMALVDSLLAALVVLSLIFSTFWVRTARAGWAVALGLALGCAGATKLYGALLLALPPLTLSLREGPAAPALRRQLRWVYAVALGLMLPVFVEPGATTLFVIENLWVFRSGFPGDPGFLTSLERTLTWHLSYLTPAGFTLTGLAAAHALVRGSRADRLLVGLWAAWCLFFVVAGGRNWFPRYLLPAIPPLLLVTARWSLRRGALGACGLVGVFAVSSWSFDRAILTAPAAAPLPAIDRWQYVENWPAGYGLAETVRFLRGEAAARGRIVLLRDSRSGPLLEGLDLAMRREPGPIDVATVDLYRDGPEPAAVGRLLAQPHAVYLALEQPTERPLVLDLAGGAAVGAAATFAKPAGLRQIEVYLVKGAEGESARGVECEVGPDVDLAPCLFTRGREPEAVRSWLEARNRDPDGLRARYDLAVARARRSRSAG